MHVDGKRVLVVGLGKSGVAAALFLRARGAHVTGNDVRTAEALGEAASRLEASGVVLVLGAHEPSLFASMELIVVSPGVPSLEALDVAERAGVEIVSEIELASRFIEAPIVGVTGTNGKSTVTSLLGAILDRTDRPHFVGGNLGTPLVDAIEQAGSRAGGAVVVELSSFQLERVSSFRASVALLLNVTDDHLDRYASFEHYAAAKERIFERQDAQDHAIVPDSDELCRALAARHGGTLHTYGGERGEVRVIGDAIVDAASGVRIGLHELKLVGAHNYDNVCAAMLAARCMGVVSAAIEAGVKGFAGLPHRMQFVRELDGVRYFDDSKATNVGASVAAIDGVPESSRVVLIAGGRDKGGSYAPLRERMERRGRALVVLGEATPQIVAGFEGSTVPVVLAPTLGEAVLRARALAKPSDVVLLAPACSSFDMFTSYAHRGDVFQGAVRALEEQP